MTSRASVSINRSTANDADASPSRPSNSFSELGHRFASKVKLPTSDDSEEQQNADPGSPTNANTLLYGKSWLVSRPGTSRSASGYMARNGLWGSSTADLELTVTPPAPLIAPADEATKSLKVAIESGNVVDKKRLFRTLIAIENMEV